MPARCYPCSIHRHPCMMEAAPPASRVPTYREWQREVLGAPRPGNSWFDVALWRCLVSDRFPRYEGCMQAPSAFVAIEDMMRYYRLGSVSYATSRALGVFLHGGDDALVYRAWGVHIVLPLVESEGVD